MITKKACTSILLTALFIFWPLSTSEVYAFEHTLSDNFDDNITNSSLWSKEVLGTGPTVTETGKRLEVTIPPYSTNDSSMPIFRAGYFSNCQFTGDFDIQVDYQLPVWPSENGTRLGFILFKYPSIRGDVGVERVSLGLPVEFPGFSREVYLTHFVDLHDVELINTMDLVGKLRVVRDNENVTGFYMSSGNWIPIGSALLSDDIFSFGIFAWSAEGLFTNHFVVVNFDNFIVNEGRFECPWYIDVPHFSQKDPDWDKPSIEYDFASLNHPDGKREIGDWGCALTSAAMILKYHGFDKGPEGQETNPANLNEYLKRDFDEENGYQDSAYTKNGGVIWKYFAKYAADAKKNGYVPSELPSLEFNYPAYNLETLKEDIEATNPGIIKIVMNDKGTSDQYDDDLHFVVGKGVSDSTVHINDPLDLQDTFATLGGSYVGKTYRQLARFTKSGTDLSYLWLYLYSDVVNILVEYNGQKTGTDETGQEFSEIPGAQYFAEGAIFNPDSLVRFGGEESGAKVFLLPKPQEGEYKFTFSGEETGFMDYELHAFDKDADVQVFSDSIFVNEEHPTQLLLNYSGDGDLEFAELQKQVDFETLRNDIWAMRRLGHTKHDLIAQVLARIITAAEKVYPHNPNTTYRLLIAFEKLLHAFHPRLVDDIAHEFLLEELEILRSSI